MYICRNAIVRGTGRKIGKFRRKIGKFRRKIGKFRRKIGKFGRKLGGTKILAGSCFSEGKYEAPEGK